MLHDCLDGAIAGAVTSFEALSDRDVAARAVQHPGALAHELRNALSVAMSTVELLERNLIGFHGRAPTTLERALRRMRDLVDRSLAEVRLRATLEPRWAGSVDRSVDYVSTTAAIDAQPRALEMRRQVEPSLHVEADRQLLVSAVTNLVQNALKFSRNGGTIDIRGRHVDGCVVIEVEDSCGGLPAGAVEHLFDAYVQAGRDRSGLGLGLPIVVRAVHALDGQVRVHNFPGKRCRFAIALPATRDAVCSLAAAASTR